METSEIIYNNRNFKYILAVETVSTASPRPRQLAIHLRGRPLTIQTRANNNAYGYFV